MVGKSFFAQLECLHLHADGILSWIFVNLFASPAILLLFTSAAVNRPPTSQSEAMLENSQGPWVKPKQIAWPVWWRNEYL